MARDPKLTALLAEAMDARALVLGSSDRSLQTIAAEHGRRRKRLARLVRLSWLAPDIVRDIADGWAEHLTGARLLDAELPIGWTAQRRALSANS